MANNTFSEGAVSAILVILLVAIANPYHLWMPNMLHLTMLAITLVVFGLLAAFVLREGAVDERESTHRMLAGRTAFLTGTATLIAGIVYQSYFDILDIWLVLVLVVMVMAKITARFYSDRNY